MIEQISIENFKCLKKIELKNVPRINLIGGKNNSGKSTVLEALFFFHDRLSADILLKHQSWRGIQNLELDSEKILTPLFYNFKIDENIKIKLNKEMMIVSAKDDHRANISHKDGNMSLDNLASLSNQRPITLEILVKENNNEVFKSHFTLNNGVHVSVNKQTSDLIKVSYLSNRTFNSPEFVQEFSRIDEKGETFELVESLKCIDDRLENLSLNIVGGVPAVYAKIDGIDRKIPVALLGDGINRLLAILMRIRICKNGILLIDEIENGFHYSFMRNIWSIIDKLSVKYNCQIFAVTHSFESLKNACNSFKDSPDAFQYIRMAVLKNGDIVPKIFDYATLATAIENNMEVR